MNTLEIVGLVAVFVVVAVAIGHYFGVVKIDVELSRNDDEQP